MKSGKILYIIAAAALLFSAQSCLMSQKDLFDKTASARVSEYMDGAMETLVSAPSGWALDLFTFAGGYSFGVEFSKNGEVNVSSELKPGEVEKSYFKLVNDDGPVLSFDTYNSLMHFFATPSSSNYEGLGGDFEFIIMNYDENRMELKGKRSGFYATLTALPSTTSISDYTLKMGTIAKDFLLLEFDSDINGDKTYTGKLNLAERTLSFARYDQDGIVIGEEFSEKYIYTENGLRLYDTLSVESARFTRFDVETATNKITTDAEGVTLTAHKIPDTYYRFENYPGDYVLKVGSDTYNVKLTVYDEFQRVLNMEGTEEYFNYELYFDFDPNTGEIFLNPQLIHQGEEVCRENEDEEVYVAILGFDKSGSGSPYYTMKGVWNRSTASPVINFESGVEIATVRGFLLWNYDSVEDFTSQYNGKKFKPKSLEPLTSLTKKK